MPEDIKDQLDAMNSYGEGEGEGESDEKVDESIDVVDDSSDEDKDKDEEKEEIIDSKDQTPDEDKEDDKEEDDKSDVKDEETELDKVKKENEALRIQIEKSHEPNVDVDVDTVDKSKESKDDKPAISEIKFLDEGIDLDELTRSPESLNAILNKVYAAGVDAYRELQEGTIKGIPEIVKSNISIQATLSKRVNEFYVDNEDLKPFKKVVASIYEELASENSDWDINKVFEEVEKETRNRLELHKKASTEDKKEKGKPKFPKTKGGKRTESKPDTNPLLDEIDAMNEF